MTGLNKLFEGHIKNYNRMLEECYEARGWD